MSVSAYFKINPRKGIVILDREIFIINEKGERISSESAHYHVELANMIFENNSELKDEFEKSGKTDPVQFLRDDKGYMTISAGERYKHVIYYSNLISEEQKKWILYYTKQGYNFIDLANDREKLEKGEK